MKSIPTRFLLSLILFILVIPMSGCLLRERRQRSEPAPVPQGGQGRPVVPAADGAAQVVETTAPGGITQDSPVQVDAVESPGDGSPPQTNDAALEAQLLDVIGALEAANQAGDPLDDLP